MQNLILILFIAIPTWVNAVALDTGNGAGFSISRFSGVAGTASQVTRWNNYLAGYHWEAECDQGTHVLCYDNQPITRFFISKNSKSAQFEYTVDTGYSSANIVDNDGNIIKITLDSNGYQTVSRAIRFQFKKDITLEGNCSTIKKVRPTAAELSSGYGYVYLVISPLRWVRCYVNLNNLELDEDLEVGFSASGTSWRIDRNIFTKVSTGLYEATGSVNDSMSLITYAEPDYNNRIDKQSLFSVYVFRVMLMMVGYIEFKITSPLMQTIDFDLRVDKIKRFQFDGYVDTNAGGVNLIVRCQWLKEGKCALSNGSEYLPVEIGFKADYGGGSPTAVLQHDVPLKLSRDNGYIVTGKDSHKSPVSLLFSMFSEDIKRLTSTNINRRFSGNMTVIIDADF